MSETLAILILLVAVVGPGVVFVKVLQRIAKKRGWSLMRTRHWMVAVSVGWPSLLLLPLLLRIPVAIALVYAVAMVAFAYVMFAGIHGWTEYFRRRRGGSGEG